MRRHLLFSIVTALLLIGALEGILSVATMLSPRVREVLAPPGTAQGPAAVLPDPRLGYRPNPAYPGHDRRGFRNPEALDRADLVVLGDSQSYGAGVDPGKEWPRQLDPRTTGAVYNISYGGYGPVHFLLLWEEAMALRPKTAVVSFYSGNDLFDAFDLVYTRGQLARLRSADPVVRDAVSAAESVEPLAARATHLFAFGEPAEPPPLPPMRGFLSRHSRLYGLARRTRHEIARRLHPPQAQDPWVTALAFARAHPAYCRIFERGPYRTVFTPQYRFSVLDPADVRVREGERIALEALREMRARAAAAGVRFLLLWIPTKELVYRDVVEDGGRAYDALTAAEAALHDRMLGTLRADGMEVVDALPALRHQLSAGPGPYPVDQDGHPTPEGHRALAGCVEAGLRGTP